MKTRNAKPKTAAFGENLSEMKVFGEITHPPFTPRETAPSGQEWIRSPIWESAIRRTGKILP